MGERRPFHALRLSVPSTLRSNLQTPLYESVGGGTNTQRSSLEQPEEFFVSLEQYAIDNRSEAAKVTDADQMLEFMDGKLIEGVI